MLNYQLSEAGHAANAPCAWCQPLLLLLLHVLPPCSFFPCKKMITLFKAEPFKVELAYAADDRIPAAYNRNLGTYSVALPKVRAILGMLAVAAFPGDGWCLC
jgi:hypothetical protein